MDQTSTIHSVDTGLFRRF